MVRQAHHAEGRLGVMILGIINIIIGLFVSCFASLSSNFFLPPNIFGIILIWGICLTVISIGIIFLKEIFRKLFIFFTFTGLLLFLSIAVFAKGIILRFTNGVEGRAVPYPVTTSLIIFFILMVIYFTCPKVKEQFK